MPDVTVETVLAGLAGLWAFLSLVVALTPSKADDDWLRRMGERLSFFQPKSSPGLLSLPGAKAREPLSYDRNYVEDDHEREGLP